MVKSDPARAPRSERCVSHGTSLLPRRGAITVVRDAEHMTKYSANWLAITRTGCTPEAHDTGNRISPVLICSSVGHMYTFSMRILLAEDEATIRAYVTQGLREAGYAVDSVADGDEALAAAQSVDYDLLILDVSMPGTDGLDVCRRLRSRPGAGSAILFLSARDTVNDRVAGLDAGAEDYLVKPFAFAELLARVRALLRRGPGDAPTLSVDDLVLDPAAHSVTRAGQPIRLTAKEFALLEYLLRNAGRLVSKTMIAEHVWDFDLEAGTNFIEVFIYSLRKKIDAPFAKPLIQTVRGAGYRIDA